MKNSSKFCQTVEKMYWLYDITTKDLFCGHKKILFRKYSLTTKKQNTDAFNDCLNTILDFWEVKIYINRI